MLRKATLSQFYLETSNQLFCGLRGDKMSSLRPQNKFMMFEFLPRTVEDAKTEPSVSHWVA